MLVHSLMTECHEMTHPHCKNFLAFKIWLSVPTKNSPAPIQCQGISWEVDNCYNPNPYLELFCSVVSVIISQCLWMFSGSVLLVKVTIPYLSPQGSSPMARERASPQVSFIKCIWVIPSEKKDNKRLVTYGCHKGSYCLRGSLALGIWKYRYGPH